MPKVEIVDMTPEKAFKLLEKNTNNRRLKSRRVDQLVRAIKTGEWQLNGAAYCTDTSGRLLDGQHRLAAIVAAGETVPIVELSGLPAVAQITMDVGVRRTFNDYLVMNGEKNASMLAACVRLLAQWELRPGVVNHMEQFSINELTRVLEANPGLRDCCNGMGASLKNTVKIPPSVVGFCIYILSKIDKDDARFFFTQLRNGTGLGLDDRTWGILKLREWANTKREHERMTQALYVGTTFKAWNAFRDGRAAGSVVWRAGTSNPEPFPMPK